MKTISTIILIFLAKGIMFSQTDSKTTGHSNHCTLTYNQKEWVVIHKDSVTNHKCGEVVIKSIPDLTPLSSPINMNITVKGFYTIKKDPSLVISDEYTVAIEDLLTGQTYNLNTQDGYTFSLNRVSRETRFVMEIKKNNLKLSSGSTASN